MTRAQNAARKFWEAVPLVMRAVFSEARKGGHNLAPNHFRILRALSHRSCNLSELAEHQDVSLPTMSASVQTLVERGWVERERSASDRRTVTLGITARGQRVVNAEYQRLMDWTACKLSALSQPEILKIEQGMEALVKLFGYHEHVSTDNPRLKVKEK
ncbi:MAG: MarR family winged helix-turn-helix transcriptional regulator [Anaerolineales bacterium]